MLTVFRVWLFTTDAEFSSNAGDSRQVSRQTFWVGWAVKLRVQTVKRAGSDVAEARWVGQAGVRVDHLRPSQRYLV